MGGRGGGKYPTIKGYYLGIMATYPWGESFYFQDFSMGMPSPLQFTVDNFGTKNYYYEKGGLVNTKTNNLKLVKTIQEVGGINLAQAALGFGFKVKANFVGKYKMKINVDYPDGWDD